MNALLHGAEQALEDMLRHKDWRARDAAIENRYIDRVDLRDSLNYSGQITLSTTISCAWVRPP
jgi:hypothetical protein